MSRSTIPVAIPGSSNHTITLSSGTFRRRGQQAFTSELEHTMTIWPPILGLAGIAVASVANAQTNYLREQPGAVSTLHAAPIAGQNAVQNIADLLSPGSADTAILPS